MEVWISSDLPQGQGLWLQQTWVWHKPSWRRSPLTPPQKHQNLQRTGETESWRTQTEPCVHQDPEERSSGPHKRLTQTCLRVSRSLRWRYGLEAACCRVGGGECGSHYIHYLHHSLVSGQTTGRIHSPAHQQKIGLKIYRAWPHPSEQDPVSPSVTLSHQEASISPLSLPLRGQIE